MKKTRLIITVALVSIIVAACGGAVPKESSAGARDTFMRTCAGCHGMDGEGKPIGAVHTPSLKREEAMNYSDDQLFEKISRGSSNMPAFKQTLTEEQMKALVRYIREEIQGRVKPKA